MEEDFSEKQNKTLIVNEEEEVPDENENMTSRVIPIFDSNPDYYVVRCICGERNPMGKLIQCNRCGCWCHQKCVTIINPFVCPFCHASARKLIDSSYSKVPTKSGDLIDKASLKNSIVSNLSLLQVNELREHIDALSQVENLIELLIQHFSSLDLYLEELRQEISKPLYHSCMETLNLEIDKEKALYTKHTQDLIELQKKLRNHSNNQYILQDFRDTINEILI